ncbi:hypothetical protein AAL_06547 [Moelleriella libera RCEF 2490]|uniref:Uncharacterized protein n=1 Tax=Moelleriella libera RCEF 2490 TaxID=1081109 RepID=A0A162IDC9_9HYPO|nr:hypothetical protein AAL_06547 [Moelleriella libera RCEF 2490]
MGYPADHKMPVRPKDKAARLLSKPGSRPSQSLPVDPQELTRRLFVLRAERKVQSDRKKRQKIEAEKTTNATMGQKPQSGDGMRDALEKVDQKTQIVSQNKLDRSSSKQSNVSSDRSNEGFGYHHVPQVAASQFTRTTTVDNADQGPIHKLAVRRVQSLRDRRPDMARHEPNLPATLGQDVSIYSSSPRNLAHGHGKHGLGDDDGIQENLKRLSAGSIPARAESPPTDALEMVAAILAPERPDVVGDPNEHRVDWTQNDEAMTKRMPSSPPKHPELRKMESKWTLKGRLGGLGRQVKDDKPPSPPTEAVLQEALSRSPKSSFFSRFKR